MATIGSESNISRITGSINDDGVDTSGASEYLLNVNSIFHKATSYNNYSAIFDIRDYFINVSSVSVQAQNALLVKSNINENQLRDNGLYQYTNDFVAFTGNSQTEDVFIIIGKSDSDSAEAGDVHQIAKNIRNKLETEFSSISTPLYNDHDTMKKYIEDMIHEISFYYFKETQNYFGQNYQTFNEKIQKAAHKFGTLYTDEVTEMFKMLNSNLQQVFDSTMADFVKKNNTLNRDVLESYMKSFRAPFDKTFYYKIRKDLVDTMLKSKNSVCVNIMKKVRSTEDNSTVVYLMKIIVDAYLKTAYPSIQYLFISSLMRQYMSRGDFVNTRMGVFSKVYLSFYMISILHLVLREVETSGNAYSNLNEVTALKDYLLQKPLLYLKKYIEAMNRIDLKDENADSDKESIEILRELQAKSTSVEKDSRKIDIIQKNIQGARLTLRNVMFNIEIQKKQLTKSIAEFWIAFSILLLMTCACIALLVMKKEFYVYYVTGITALGVLIYKLVLLIIYLVNKN
jgi:hypothetical protein